MNQLKMMFSRFLPVRWHARKMRPTRVAVLVVMLGVTGLAIGDGLSIFRPFPNDDGKVQSAPAKDLGLPDLDESNVFFQTNFGGSLGNGQSCATCHRPADGMTVHVTTIQNAFESSGGTDPLFRFNDTANDPNSPKNTGSVDERRDAYSLTLALGVTRIGRTLPANAEFIVAPQNTEKFGPLPCDPNNPTNRCTDPQQPTSKTLSLFRRPLVQTNMRFDSAVLWDGRADIRNIRAQVIGAAKTLLLTPTPSNAAADEAAHSQLGIFTDQVIDDRSSFPSSFAGNLSAQHANGGVKNLVDFAFDPTGPCIYTAPSATLGPRERTHTITPAEPTYFTPGPGVLTPSTCIDVEPGGPNMTTFKAWLTIPVDDTDITNISRRRIAHGEEIFNTAVLQIDTTPPDGSASRDENELRLANQLLAEQLGATTIHCTSCHATNNIGNHPEASFFVRIGSDSVPLLRALADKDHNTDPFGNLDNFVTRTQKLPQYCLRSAKTGAPPLPGPGVTGAVTCGDFQGMPAFCKPTSSTCIPGDVTTSDPGRAMTTGKWADIGKFKPPILRGLATRSPYFHGSAADSTVSIIEFYNVRFNIGLSESDKEDLVRFVEAH